MGVLVLESGDDRHLTGQGGKFHRQLPDPNLNYLG
jgi:hypothetical protein